MATDLNLHRRSTGASPDTPEGRARDREVRNRERTWIICFCLDRSFSAQMGKPYSIKEEYVHARLLYLVMRMLTGSRPASPLSPECCWCGPRRAAT